MFTKISIFLAFYVIICNTVAEKTQIDGFTLIDGIYEVGEPDWKRFLQKYNVALVNYHIPWCKHCKTLAPEFDKLAQFIGNQKDLPIPLAKVND